MKKLMTLLTGGLLLAAVQLSAQSTAAAKPVIMTTDGEEIRAASVELTQSGDYRYAESLKDGSPKLSVRRNRVRWAWIPKPEETALRNSRSSPLNRPDFTVCAYFCSISRCRDPRA